MKEESTPGYLPLASELKAALQSSPLLHKAAVLKVLPLAGDASARQYFRIHLSGAPVSSVIFTKLARPLDPFSLPPLQRNIEDSSAKAYNFLKPHNVSLPVLYADFTRDGFLLSEDVGDVSLRTLAFSEEIDFERVALHLNQAIDQLINLQSIPRNSDFPFDRSLTYELYRSQIARIQTYLLEPAGMNRGHGEVLGKVFAAISESIAGHPKVLSHYDYVAHNLHICDDDRLVMIDYQDICLESYARDLSALLQDRDFGDLVGVDIVKKAYKRFLDKSGAGDDFRQHYLEYRFHWNCRVSGQFRKLVTENGKPLYEQWIAGSLRRLGQSSVELVGAIPRMDDFIEIAGKYLPDFRGGVESEG